MAVAHLAVDLGLGHQGGHGVHHDDVQGAAAHQLVADLQGLLAAVRLADEEVVHVHAQLLGVFGIQGVLGVDVGRQAALLLGLGHHVQGQGGLAAGLRPVDFHHAALGHPAHAQRRIQGDGAGADDFDALGGAHAVAQLHDGALAEGPLDVGDGAGQGFQAVILLGCGHGVLRKGCFPGWSQKAKKTRKYLAASPGLMEQPSAA